MSEQWYYAKDDQQQGPLTIEQINQQAASGSFGPSDLVWKDGMAEWKAASQVPEIKFGQAPAAVGPPTPPKRKAAPVATSTITDLTDSLPNVPPILWSILTFAAAGLLFLAFFVPWWGFTLKNLDDKDVGKATQKDIDRVMNDSMRWMEDNLSSKKRDELGQEIVGVMFGKEEKASVIEWGWSTGTGVMGLIFVFLIVPVALVPLIVKPLESWAWIGRFAVAIPGLIMLIMFLVWFFGAPSKNVSPVMSQGLYFGPYMIFLAGGLLFFGGLAGGLLGLLEFLKERKADKVPVV